MDVRLPDGRVIQNVPDGITQSQLMGQVERFDVDAGQSTTEDVIETIADTGQSAVASVGQLPLGATQLITDTIAAVQDPREGRAVAETFQQELNSETKRLMDAGLEFNDAVSRAGENVRDSGVIDPASFNIEDIRRAQAGAARSMQGLQDDAASTSPIVAGVTDFATKALQIAPLAPSGIVSGGATFLGAERGLAPTTDVQDPIL